MRLKMTDWELDLVNILGSFTNYVQNERVRSYNEGVDAERERCAKALETHMPDSRCMVSLANAAAIVRAADDDQQSTSQEKP